MMPELLFLLIGLAIGAAVAWVAATSLAKGRLASQTAELEAKARAADSITAELRSQIDKAAAEAQSLRAKLEEEGQARVRAETQLAQERENLAAQQALVSQAETRFKEAFEALASKALKGNNQSFLELAREDLTARQQAIGKEVDGKKALIDQSLKGVAERMEQVRQFLERQGNDWKQNFGQFTTSVSSLTQATGDLHKILASSQRRGEWGQRMAEDVLRLVGLVENVNYVKQSSADAEGGRADFTFYLPNDLKVNMDAKFPLDSYRAYLDAPDDKQRQAHLSELCTAVRGHVRDVARRGYIDPKVPTVPYVIVFIASEQIYSLVLQAQPDLIDEALSLKVVMTGPLTLYAQLAIMRQAAENFNVMKTADEVISLLGQFYKQWQKYNEELDLLGNRIDGVSKQFGVVRTTRSNMLQRPLDKIEELRQSRQLPEANSESTPAVQ
jgi:DNA recombination protein RmuC